MFTEQFRQKRSQLNMPTLSTNPLLLKRWQNRKKTSKVLLWGLILTLTLSCTSPLAAEEAAQPAPAATAQPKAAEPAKEPAKEATQPQKDGAHKAETAAEPKPSTPTEPVPPPEGMRIGVIPTALDIGAYGIGSTELASFYNDCLRVRLQIIGESFPDTEKKGFYPLPKFAAHEDEAQAIVRVEGHYYVKPEADFEVKDAKIIVLSEDFIHSNGQILIRQIEPDFGFDTAFKSGVRKWDRAAMNGVGIVFTIARHGEEEKAIAFFPLGAVSEAWIAPLIF